MNAKPDSVTCHLFSGEIGRRECALSQKSSPRLTPVIVFGLILHHWEEKSCREFTFHFHQSKSTDALVCFMTILFSLNFHSFQGIQTRSPTWTRICPTMPNIQSQSSPSPKSGSGVKHGAATTQKRLPRQSTFAITQ